MAVDGMGNLYVATNGTEILKFAPGCTSTSCASSAGTGGANIWGVAVDGSGNVYSDNYGTPRQLGRLNPTSPPHSTEEKLSGPLGFCWQSRCIIAGATQCLLPG